MARRLHVGPSDKLTEDELDTLRRRLSAMSMQELRIYYSASHAACHYVLKVPSPKLMQELVQAWRELYKRKPMGRG
jgi:hypothetical protein